MGKIYNIIQINVNNLQKALFYETFLQIIDSNQFISKQEENILNDKS